MTSSDKKIRLNIPCLVCPKPHNYIIGTNVFYGRDIFTLSCTYTGVEIGFIGTPEAVKAAMKRSEMELAAMLEEAGLDDFDRIRGEDTPGLTDPQVEDIVRFMLRELVDERAVHCMCDGQSEGDYDFYFTDDGVVVFCRDCKASAELPITGVVSAADFLRSDEIRLSYNGSSAPVIFGGENKGGQTSPDEKAQGGNSAPRK